MTKGTFTKKFWLSILINFGGMLAVLTLARQVAGNSGVIYLTIASLWFIALLVFNLKLFGGYVAAQWHEFAKNKWRNILYVVIVLVLLEVAVTVANLYFHQFIPSAKSAGIVQYEFSTVTIVGTLWGIVGGLGDLVAAFVEELAYRHESMYVFKSKGKLLTGIMVIVSSLLFGFSHYYNFNGSLIATMPYVIAGVILSLSYLISKNFWVPTLAHLLFNSLSILSALVLLGIQLVDVIR
ncbi:CPBP family intramembrane glutamic endopeptidase [Latilactobacillus fuchuensis]|uniref:CPBP family intramembrane glutamic endopeptidase n=1 Tax=Latilactobacillus fuchuensis TaxID=164393 RepID=UPI0039AF00CD